MKGIIYITLSALFFGSYGVWSKLMGNSFGEFTQAWTRAFLLLLILLPLGFLTNQFQKIQKPDWKWFALVSLGGLNQAPFYYAFKYLDIGTATLLFYGSLTITGYFVGKIVFKEHIGLIKLISLLLAFSGMLVLFGFAITTDTIIPALSAVVAGIIGGIEVTLTKKISNNYSNIQILPIIFLVMLFGNVPIAFIYQEIPPQLSNPAWFAQLGYAISMLLSMYFVVKGFKYIEASIGSILGLTEIIFAIVLGIVIFDEKITNSIIVGASFVIIAAVLPNIRLKKIFCLGDEPMGITAINLLPY